MNHTLFVFLGMACLSPRALPLHVQAPILLELFTSEGCSSCPPADELLTLLDRTQPVAGAEIIVLSEHVDYWNRLGWIDRNSSELFSARQAFYAKRLHTGDIYTPQLLVDGKYQVVGSSPAAVDPALLEAARTPKLPIDLTQMDRASPSSWRISINASSPPAPADVYVALAREQTSSNVTSGENSGRRLTHTAVAFSIEKIGTIRTRTWQQDVELSLQDTQHEAIRIVVFAQDQKTGRILGAAQVKEKLSTETAAAR